MRVTIIAECRIILRFVEVARCTPVQLAAQIGVCGLFWRGVVRDAQGCKRAKEEGCGAFHGMSLAFFMACVSSGKAPNLSQLGSFIAHLSRM